MSSKARENILKRISKALESPVAEPYAPVDPEQIFPKSTQDLDISFAEAFTRLQGNFSFCFSHNELVQQLAALAEHKGWKKWFCSQPKFRQIFASADWPFGWHNNLAESQASITGCEALVARTGSIVVSSRASGGRTPSVYAPAHICIAYTSQLVYDVKDALDFLEKKYEGNIPSMISFTSGPSRTADIEKTLVTGIHGPKEVYCFLVEG